MPAPRALAGIAAGVLFGGLAFSQAAGALPLPALQRLALPAFRDSSYELARVDIATGSGWPPKIGRPAEARQIATDSLRHSPLNPAALLLLALLSPPQAQGKLADLAEQLTRRQTGVQLLQMQRNLTSQRYAEAMTNVDRLLVVNPEMAAQIFPLLVSALPGAELRGLLRKALASNPPWASSFVAYAANDPRNAVPLAQLVQTLKRPKQSDDSDLAASLLIPALVDQGRTDLVRTIFSRWPGQPAAGLAPADAGGFAAIGGFAPLTWDLPAASHFGASASAGARKGTIDLSAWIDHEQRGVPVSKLLWLAPGRWTLSWTPGGSVAAGNGTAFLTVRCADAAHTAISSTSNLFAKGAPRRLVFTVPPRCRAVIAELQMVGSDEGRAELALGALTLTRGGEPAGPPFTSPPAGAKGAPDRPGTPQ
jgi:hypothetical protein